MVERIVLIALVSLMGKTGRLSAGETTYDWTKLDRSFFAIGTAFTPAFYSHDSKYPNRCTHTLQSCIGSVFHCQALASDISQSRLGLCRPAVQAHTTVASCGIFETNRGMVSSLLYRIPAPTVLHNVMPRAVGLSR